MAEDSHEIALTRIASALGVSVNAFYADDAPERERSTLRVRVEAMEMEVVFAAVADPARRRECIEFVRRAASVANADDQPPGVLLSVVEAGPPGG